MRPGKALAQTYTAGMPDFPGDSHGTTFSAGGPGRMVEAMKCANCGWSVTKGKDMTLCTIQVGNHQTVRGDVILQWRESGTTYAVVTDGHQTHQGRVIELERKGARDNATTAGMVRHYAGAARQKARAKAAQKKRT